MIILTPLRHPTVQTTSQSWSNWSLLTHFTFSIPAVMWNGTVPRVPSCGLQPSQPQRHAAHHTQAAAVWRPSRLARGCALHPAPTAFGKTVRCERGHRFGPSPVLPGGVRFLQLHDSSCLPLTCVSLPELVWQRAVLASAVGLGALPEVWPQQVCGEDQELGA